MKQYAPLETAKEIAFKGFYWPFKRMFPGTRAAIAGSILRKHETVHDIDIVIEGRGITEIWKWTKKQIDCDQRSDGGVNLKGTLYGFHTDVWFTVEDEWAPMLLFATGPKDWNMFMRSRAKAQGMILNSRGLWKILSDGGHGPRLDNNTEGNIIFQILHRNWVPPEERDFIGFKKRESKIKDCDFCHVPFQKGESIVRSDRGTWIHERHVVD